MSLTTRQWELYKYLKQHSHEYKLRKEILEDLKDLYPERRENQEFNNTTARRELSRDLTALKKSEVIQTVIISSPARGIKLATESEFVNYLEKNRISLLKALKVNYTQMVKAKLNGQKRIVLNYEKDIIESLLKDEKVS